MSPRALGITQTALSGLCFGILGLTGKHLFAAGSTPGELLALRFAGAALVLWPAMVALHPREWRLPGRPLAACAALGIFGYALFSNLFFIAVRGLPASLAVLLLYTYPAIVTAVAWALWGQRVPPGRGVALPLTLGGLVLLVWQDLAPGRLAALGPGLGSAIFYAAYILASSRWLAGIRPLVSVTWILTFAGLAMVLLHLRDPGRAAELVTAEPWAFAALILVGTVAAMALFMAGLQRLRPWEVSLLSTLEPVTGIALAAAFLGERLTPLQAGGGLLVLTGLVVVSLPARQKL
jgi:drug/metabolite transporter (DMT)-like permease